jgi:hypothetical protein
MGLETRRITLIGPTGTVKSSFKRTFVSASTPETIIASGIPQSLSSKTKHLICLSSLEIEKREIAYSPKHSDCILFIIHGSALEISKDWYQQHQTTLKSIPGFSNIPKLIIVTGSVDASIESDIAKCIPSIYKILNADPTESPCCHIPNNTKEYNWNPMLNRIKQTKQETSQADTTTMTPPRLFSTSSPTETSPYVAAAPCTPQKPNTNHVKFSTRGQEALDAITKHYKDEAEKKARQQKPERKKCDTTPTMFDALRSSFGFGS